MSENGDSNARRLDDLAERFGRSKLAPGDQGVRASQHTALAAKPLDYGSLPSFKKVLKEARRAPEQVAVSKPRTDAQDPLSRHAPSHRPDVVSKGITGSKQNPQYEKSSIPSHLASPHRFGQPSDLRTSQSLHGRQPPQAVGSNSTNQSYKYKSTAGKTNNARPPANMQAPFRPSNTLCHGPPPGQNTHRSYNPFEPIPVNSERWKMNTSVDGAKMRVRPNDLSTSRAGPSDKVKIPIPSMPKPVWRPTSPAPNRIPKAPSPSRSKFHETFIDPAATQESIKTLFQDAFDQTNGADSNVDEVDGGGYVDGVNVRLLKHQIQALKFLIKRETGGDKVSFGGILADDMGLGKTVQMLALMNKHPRPDEERSSVATTLVVAPLALIRQWEHEIKSKTSMKCYVHHGPKRITDPKQLGKYDVVITTYNVVVSESANKKALDSDDSDASDSPRDESAANALFGLTWWRVILDEAQTIKNKSSKSAQGCCALKSVNRWCLSGTPIQNNVDELYSLLKFLRIPPLHEFSVWRDQITWPINNGRGQLAIKRLQLVLSAIMIRRTKATLQKASKMDESALFNLPERMIKPLNLDFSPSERQFYNSLEMKLNSTLQKIMENEDMSRKYTNILCLLLRLRQACCHPSLVASKLSMDTEALSIGSAVHQVSAADQEVDELASALDSINIEKPSGIYFCENCKSEFRATADENSGKYCAACKAVQAIPPTSTGSEGGQKLTDMSSIKLQYLVRILKDDLEDDTDEMEPRKTIIFSQFTSMLTLIEPLLRKEQIPFVRYDGSMPNQAREKSLASLRTDPHTRVFLCSLKCGALGLNLTAASRVVLLDLWWNPAIEDQAIDRVHRIGQTRSVVVYKMVVRDSVEERILALQEKKRELASGALGDKMDASHNKLTMQDILYLFKSERYYDT